MLRICLFISCNVEWWWLGDIINWWSRWSTLHDECSFSQTYYHMVDLYYYSHQDSCWKNHFFVHLICFHSVAGLLTSSFLISIVNAYHKMKVETTEEDWKLSMILMFNVWGKTKPCRKIHWLAKLMILSFDEPRSLPMSFDWNIRLWVPLA